MSRELVKIVFLTQILHDIATRNQMPTDMAKRVMQNVINSVVFKNKKDNGDNQKKKQ
jgi:hypothetical protein